MCHGFAFLQLGGRFIRTHFERVITVDRTPFEMNCEWHHFALNILRTAIIDRLKRILLTWMSLILTLSSNLSFSNP